MGIIYAAPRVPREFIERSRLTAALNTGAQLTVVRGAAGLGKTVAVAQWASSESAAGTPGVWFSIDESTATRLAFWHGLLQTILDAGLVPPGGILETSIHSLDVAPDLRRLLQRGFAQLPANLVIVIDNYQLAEDISEDILALLRGGAQLRLVVVTRALGRLESGPVAVTLAPTVLRPDDIVLTREETAHIVASADVDDDGKLADALWQVTGGSPLSVRSVIVAIQRGEFQIDAESLEERIAEIGSEVLREILLSEAAGTGEFEFALRSSVADRLTPELAELLTGRSDAAALLAGAEGAGVGMWGQDSTGPFFAYSPMVRSALRTELRNRFPGEVQPLGRKSAKWSFDNGHSFSALRQAIAIDDLSLASQIAMRDWFFLLSFHADGVRELIAPISLLKLRRYPLLAMMLALIYNASGIHRLRAVELFGVALAAARIRGEKAEPAERAVLLAIESIALRLIGRIDPAVAGAKRAIAALDALSVRERESLDVTLPTLLTQTGITFFYGGDGKRAFELFQQAFAHPKTPMPGSWYHALALSAGVLAVRGDMRGASELVELGKREQWPEGWREGYIGSMFQLAWAFLALEDGDYALAQSRVSAIAPHLETIEHWPLFMHVQALIDLATGRASVGITVLNDAMSRGARPSITNYTKTRLDATRSLLLLGAGRTADAESLLKKHPASEPTIAIAWARLHLLIDAPESALRAVHAIDQDAVSTRLWAETLSLRAAAALRLGRVTMATENLDRALTLMQDRGLRTPFTMLPLADRQALSRARGRRSDQPAEFLTELVAAESLWPENVSRISLTARERVVLEALARSSGAVEISEALFVSTNTVKSQLRGIYRKLGATNRDEALLAAREQGLLER